MNALPFLTVIAAAQFSAAGAGPPAEPIKFGHVELRTGIRMRYAERGDSTGMPVILLHGYSDSWFSYSPVMPLLSTRYRVFALDQRGHGQTDKPESGYTMRHLAQDVIAFMDAKGLERATIVGHSMGSFVAQQVAVVAPARVDRMVLIASTTTPRTIVGIGALEGAVLALTDPVSKDFVRDFQVSTVFQPLPAEFMDRVVAESLQLPARVWHAIMAGLLATPRADELQRVRIPTLILWGDRDAAFPHAEQQALAALIPNSVLRIYTETGHSLHWERPKEFVQDLEAFLDVATANPNK